MSTEKKLTDSSRTNTLSVIWNVTNKCPWQCKFCIMDAGMDCSKKELVMKEKLKICENIDIKNVRIDFSGGEFMLEKDNHFKLIKVMSQKFGKANIGISTSGYGIGENEAEFLASKVSDVEMTMDAVPGVKYPYRQDEYHRMAGQAVKVLKKHGICVGLQTVLTKEHLRNESLLENLLQWMTDNHVDKWSLIRYFSYGRGHRFQNLEMSEEENCQVVSFVKELCNKDRNAPELDIHYLLPGSLKDGSCRCVKKSVGILPDGSVTSCFWGLNENGSIKDDRFYLGNLLEKPLSEILQSENAKYWNGYCGDCPILKNRR